LRKRKGLEQQQGTPGSNQESRGNIQRFLKEPFYANPVQSSRGRKERECGRKKLESNGGGDFVEGR